MKKAVEAGISAIALGVFVGLLARGLHLTVWEALAMTISGLFLVRETVKEAIGGKTARE